MEKNFDGAAECPIFGYHTGFSPINRIILYPANIHETQQNTAAHQSNVGKDAKYSNLQFCILQLRICTSAELSKVLLI